MEVKPDSVASKSSNRKVWVINKYHEPYTEEFRGTSYTFPPNSKKEVLLSVGAANRLLSQMTTPPPEKYPDGRFKNPPKALHIVELTEEDHKRLFGKKEDGQNTEEQIALTCMLCGTQHTSEKGLKIHMGKMHQGAEPVKEE